jgi:hypothetical protein
LREHAHEFAPFGGDVVDGVDEGRREVGHRGLLAFGVEECVEAVPDLLYLPGGLHRDRVVAEVIERRDHKASSLRHLAVHAVLTLGAGERREPAPTAVACRAGDVTPATTARRAYAPVTGVAIRACSIAI